RIGNAVTMVVQPTFSTRGDGARFALLMVTPDVPTVTLARASLFHDLAVVTAPNVVHQQKTVEDPTLGTQCGGGYYSDAGGCGGGFGGSYGGPVNPPVYQPPTPGAEDAGIPADVTTLGPYELAVLGGADLAAVEAWLTAHNYFFDSNDTAALAPYLALGWTVTAVRVSSKPAAMVPLTPIAFTFESDVLRLPVAVAHDPSGGTMPLTAYVAADGRYDFTGANVPYAEYSNTVTGAGFLTRNDLTIDLSAPIDLDPIGVRDYGNTEHQDSVTVIDEVHVPVSQCDPAPSARGSGCGCGCNVAGERALPFPLVAFVLFIALRLAWRRRS
ncbi:MAG TPA: DUF2330 domain-containing protein, partial [Polyangia bacterium]|nr:DUF2330 domain-containing protein [Polyangia bacterium]